MAKSKVAWLLFLPFPDIFLCFNYIHRSFFFKTNVPSTYFLLILYIYQNGLLIKLVSSRGKKKDFKKC